MDRLLAIFFLVHKRIRLLRMACHSWLQIAYLRSKGHQIGHNVKIGYQSFISVTPGGKLVIGDDTRIDDYATLIIVGSGELKLGCNVYIGRRSTISAQTKVSIGDYCLIAHNVTIIDSTHKMLNDSPIETQGAESNPITIGNNSWLATGVVVLKDVQIGKNCIVGAQSVVTKNVQDNHMIAGIPAQIIKTTVSV